MMRDYLEELKSLLSEPPESVRERELTEFDRQLAKSNGRVVLFGAGNLGRKSLACLRDAGIEPLAFSDNSSSKWGTQVDGVPVLSPIEAAKKYGTSALFVVTIWSPRSRHFYPCTRVKLQGLGCLSVVSCCSLYWRFAAQMLPDYCRDLPHRIYDNAHEVLDAGRVWKDEYSRCEYVQQIRWRALGDMDALNPPVVEDQYFLDSMYGALPGEIFVDCGAYDGDTVKKFTEWNSGFAKIVAVEADPSNFCRLLATLRTLKPDIAQRVYPINAAVAGRRGEFRFKATGAEGAHLSTDGDVVVACISVDELECEGNPTFIKMDIEGTELDALHGAKRAIGHSPLLSVCVYHRQSDIWNIPLFIRALNPDYSLFLRPHDVDGWDVVCYAVPPNRLKS